MNTKDLRIGIDFNPTCGIEQASVDVGHLKDSGLAFAWGKVSEGIGWSKPATNTMKRVHRALRIDFPMGVYHFGWGNDTDSQVETFLRAIGGVSVARKIGLCCDVETYKGHTGMRRGHVLGFYRELAKRVGKDVTYFAYSGDWYWKARIDTGRERPVLEVLEEEGIRVRVWSSPDTGYSDRAGESIRASARRVPESEFARGFSGKGASIVQVDDACREAGLYPIDGNVTKAGRATIRDWFNWKHG